MFLFSSPGFMCFCVVDELHVIGPAVDDGGDHLLQVEPERIPVRALAANVMHHIGPVDPGLDLTAAVSRNWKKEKKKN